MRGEQHILISILSMALLLAPWIPNMEIPWALVFFTGVFIGSLAPDADAANATIMHGLKVGSSFRGLGRHISVFLPIIGYLIRYLIYYPLSALFWIATFGRIKPHHRGLLHSLPGIALTTVLLISYLRVACLLCGSGEIWFLIPLGGGFFAGSLLHLAEDACTKSGICWKFPFGSARIRGDIITGNRWEKRPEIMGGVLGGCTVLVLVAQPVLGIPWEMTRISAAIILVVAWGGFLSWTGVRSH